MSQLVTAYKLGTVSVDGDEVVWTRKGKEKRLPMRAAGVGRFLNDYTIVNTFAKTRELLPKVEDPAALQRLREQLDANRASADASFRAEWTALRAEQAEASSVYTDQDAPLPLPTRPTAPLANSMPRVAGSEVKVKTYKNAKAYERDAPLMAGGGWRPQGQVQGAERVAIGKTARHVALTGGLGLLLGGRAHKDGRMTVTWVR